MKCAASTILLGLLALALSACAAAADSPIQDMPAAAATGAPPSPTIVWFPPSVTPTPQLIATIPPTPERKPGIEGLVLADDFSTAGPWNPAASEEASIEVSLNRLTIAVQPGVTAYRVRQGVALQDFYAELTARPSLCRNTDNYGLLFRAPSNAAYYGFAVSCDGTSFAERVRLGQPYELHAPVPSADAPVGAPGEVRLGVWVSGSDMRFFLNGRYQFSISDRAYASGSVGAFAHSAGDTPVAVTFSDLSVYEVSYSPPSGTPTP